MAEARTPEELVARLLDFLPAQFDAATILLAGAAAATAQAETTWCSLHDCGTIEGATGIWLDLHGEGLGVFRQAGELDAGYRDRIRDLDDLTTPGAVLGAAIAVFGTAILVEWFDSPYLDVDAYLDTVDCVIGGGPDSFVLLLPGVSFAGPEYDTLIRAIEANRGLGIAWAVALIPTP